MLKRTTLHDGLVVLLAIVTGGIVAFTCAFALAHAETASAAAEDGCGPVDHRYAESGFAVAAAVSTEAIQSDSGDEVAPHTVWRTRCTTVPGYYRTVNTTRRTCGWERVENPGGAGSSLQRVCRSSTYRTREWVPPVRQCTPYRAWHPHIIWHR